MPREGLEERRDDALALLRGGATNEAAEILFENILRLLAGPDFAYWMGVALARERRRGRKRCGDRRPSWAAARIRNPRRRRRRPGRPTL
jgi:hypothetical protein